MPKRFRGVLSLLASHLGEASRARAAGAKPLQPERASSALSAKRLVFSKDFLLFLSCFVMFFPGVPTPGVRVP